MVFFATSRQISLCSVGHMVGSTQRLLSRTTGVHMTCTIQSPVQPGQYAEMKRSFSHHDVRQYADLIQDPNPLHASSIDSQRHPLYRRSARHASGSSAVVHGMLVASLFGSIVGTLIPQAVYLTQNITFRRPVFTEDIVVARIEVLSIQGGTMTCQTVVKDEATKEIVVEGQASVWIPRDFR